MRLLNVKIPKKINSYLLVVVLIAGILRFYRLGDFPTEFYHDEAAKGYNAYSLLRTGRTFRGLNWPLYFTDFSDIFPSTAVVYNYAVIPFVGLFGLNKVATRLPAAIFGTGTVLILYYLSKALFRKRSIALLAALFLAISPWHIHMSRYALEPITFPFFFLWGWLLLQKAVGKTPAYLPISMVLLAISLYSYRTSLLFIPFFLLSYFLVYRKFFWERKRISLLSLGAFLLVSLPLIYLYLTKTAEMTAYYNKSVSLSSLPTERRLLFFVFLGYYLDHFLLSFWLYLSPIVVFSFLGFRRLVKEYRHLSSVKILIANLFLVVLPSSLTLNWLVPNPTRSIGMTGFMEMLAAYGFLTVLPKLNSKKIFLVFLFCFSAINGLILAKYVFPDGFCYSSFCDPGSEKLSRYINSVENEYQKIFITNKGNQLFIYLLFFNKYPPEKFLREEVKRHYRGGFEAVDSFGKYTFCDINECWQPNPDYLFVGQPNDLPSWPAKLYIEEDGVRYFKVFDSKK